MIDHADGQMPEDVPTCDADAWQAYPHHRHWFDRLRLAMRLNHLAGPCGVAPPESGEYVVRPIYNLSGMGVGATMKRASAGDWSLAPPGYFWCERFTGTHLSMDLEWMPEEGIAPKHWKAVSAWRGTPDRFDPTKFNEWRRFDLMEPLPSDTVPHLPVWLNELHDVGRINIEAIGGKIIEVHLRGTPDPQDSDLFIPVHASQYPPTIPPGFVWQPDYDDADGHLKDPRFGFLKRKVREHD